MFCTMRFGLTSPRVTKICDTSFPCLDLFSHPREKFRMLPQFADLQNRCRGEKLFGRANDSWKFDDIWMTGTYWAACILISMPRHRKAGLAGAIYRLPRWTS